MAVKKRKRRHKRKTLSSRRNKRKRFTNGIRKNSHREETPGEQGQVAGEYLGELELV